MMNELSYHLDKSTIIFGGNKSDLKIVINFFFIKFLYANIIAPDGMPHSAASHLGLLWLPMLMNRTPQAYMS